MCKLDWTRIEKELHWRLLISFDDAESASIMLKRCLEAIKCKSLKKLYEPFKIVKTVGESRIVTIIDEKKILEALSESGVHDMVCMCINAQN